MNKVMLHECRMDGNEREGYRASCLCRQWAGAVVVSFDLAWDAWAAHREAALKRQLHQ